MEPYYAYIKLITGEELLSLILQEDSIELVIEKPIHLLRKTSGDGDSLLLFLTWLPTGFSSINVVTIGRDKVMYTLPLDEATVNTVKKYSEIGYKPETQKSAFEPPANSSNLVDSSPINTFDELEELLNPKKN